MAEMATKPADLSRARPGRDVETPVDKVSTPLRLTRTASQPLRHPAECQANNALALRIRAPESSKVSS
jgi:hypothetical protein